MSVSLDHAGRRRKTPLLKATRFVFVAFTGEETWQIEAKSLRQAAGIIHRRTSEDNPPLAIIRSDCLVERSSGKITALVVKPAKGPQLPI